MVFYVAIFPVQYFCASKIKPEWMIIEVQWKNGSNFVRVINLNRGITNLAFIKYKYKYQYNQQYILPYKFSGVDLTLRKM